MIDFKYYDLILTKYIKKYNNNKKSVNLLRLNRKTDDGRLF